jgi:catechol 2,3-dioxygenase-like lactoylglutathione lyase family enzyme
MDLRWRGEAALDRLFEKIPSESSRNEVLNLKLAKPHIDIGVMTERLEAMLAFWQGPAGLSFEGVLPTGGGNHQHRHGAQGSVFKLNHPRAGLPATSPTGYRTMWIARAGLAAREELVDPDGNHFFLVPPGEQGIEGVALTVGVRDTDVQARFYRDALEFEEIAKGGFRCGDSLVFVEDDSSGDGDASFYGPGIRYFTIQVLDCRREHARILEAGGSEGLAPRQLGDVAVISMVRDPHGNWIEISQRGSLTGSL